MISNNLQMQKGSSELMGMGEVVKINDIFRRTNIINRIKIMLQSFKKGRNIAGERVLSTKKIIEKNVRN